MRKKDEFFDSETYFLFVFIAHTPAGFSNRLYVLPYFFPSGLI